MTNRRNAQTDDEMLDDSPEAIARVVASGNISADELRLLIERIERLEEEKKGMADDIKDVYAEAKATGFDASTMRKIIALRKIDKDKRDETEALLETYMFALGMS